MSKQYLRSNKNRKLEDTIPDTQINTQTNGAQFNPSIASLKDGGFVMAWSSGIGEGSGQDGDSYGVYMQRYGLDGRKKGEETQVNSYIRDQQRAPSIASLDNGDFVIAWHSKDQDGSGWGIYMQRYGLDGTPKGVETRVNSSTKDDQTSPAIASLTDGDFIVAWGSKGGVVYMQRYDLEGNEKGRETQVSTVSGYTYDDYASPSITSFTNGDFIVAWDNNLELTDNGSETNIDSGIYMQRYSLDGSKKGVETQVHSRTDDDQDYPSIVGLQNEDFAVVWESDHLNHDDIYMQRYDLDNNKKGVETRVNSYIGNDQRRPSTTTLTSGDFVVAWQSGYWNGGRRQDGDGWGIYMQRYGLDGSKKGVETRVNSHTDGDQENPSTTSLIDGDFIVAWGSKTQDGSSIFAQRFNPQGEKVSFTQLTIQNLSQELSFNQIDSQISFQEDITILPLLESDLFTAQMILKQSGAVLDDESQFAIQQSSLDENGVGSEFRNGTLTARGTASQVNSFLRDLRIDIGEGFIDSRDNIDDFLSVDVSITDETNNQTITGEINAHYQCLELPQELINVIDDQTTPENKTLVMDFVEYFSDPERFVGATHNLTQIFNEEDLSNPNRTLEIHQLNQTAFEAFAPNMSNIELSFETEGYCREVISQNFLLNPPQSESQESSSNLGMALGIAGGALLFTALSCFAYKKFNDIASEKARVVDEQAERERRAEQARREQSEREARQRQQEEERRAEQARREQSEREARQRQESENRRREEEQKRAEVERERRAEQARREQSEREARQRQESENRRREERRNFPPPPPNRARESQGAEESKSSQPINEKKRLAQRIIDYKEKKGVDVRGVLDIDESATKAEAKKAWRGLSFKFHPDKKTGDETPDTSAKAVVASQILSEVNEKLKNWRE